MLLPQKQEIKRIQINQSQELLLPPNNPLHPHPHPHLLSQSSLHPQRDENRPEPFPHNESKMMIQMKFPQPQPLLFQLQELLEQPQFVAVKSLMFFPPKIFIYALFYAHG